jgi:hypothetical protein
MSMKRWILIAFAGMALAPSVGAVGLAPEHRGLRNGRSLDIVVRVPSGGAHAWRCEILVFDGPASEPDPRLALSLPAPSLPAWRARLCRRAADLTRLAIRIGVALLERVAGEEMRAPLPR